MKIINSKKSKLTRKQYFMLLGTMVASLSFTAPVLSIKALAAEDEEVLFEDQEDDYNTEDIKEDDVVQDNTVVESEPAKEETKQEEQKQEENKNDGGSCVTPDKGYDEKAGENWDPEIKTESEKKHRKPVAPPLAEFVPRTPTETPEDLLKPVPNPTQETRQVPQQPTPAQAPAPAPAPKTGDITMNELYALLAGLAVGANTIGMVAGKVAKNIRRKR